MRQIVVTTTPHDVEARRALLMMKSVSLKLTLWSILWDLIVTRQIVDFDRALKGRVFWTHQKQRVWRSQIRRLKISL